jgi:hypothetical protein
MVVVLPPAPMRAMMLPDVRGSSSLSMLVVLFALMPGWIFGLDIRPLQAYHIGTER